MKTITKFALAGALGFTLASATVAVNAQPATADLPPAPEGAPAGAPAGRGIAPLLNRLLEKYDINHDGQLDKAEMETFRKDIDGGKIQPPFGQRGGPGLGDERRGQADRAVQDRPARQRSEAG